MVRFVEVAEEVDYVGGGGPWFDVCFVQHGTEEGIKD